MKREHQELLKESTNFFLLGPNKQRACHLQGRTGNGDEPSTLVAPATGYAVALSTDHTSVQELSQNNKTLSLQDLLDEIPTKRRTATVVPCCALQTGGSTISNRKGSVSLPVDHMAALTMASELSSALPSTSPPSNGNISQYDVWERDFQDFLKSEGFQGSLLIRGLNEMSREDNIHLLDRRTIDERETSVDDDDRSHIPRRDLEQLRYILLTEHRSRQLIKVKNMIIGNESVVEYDQHGTFSRRVHKQWHQWNLQLHQIKDPDKRLDYLIAMTYFLNEYDAWMYDDPACDDGHMMFMVQSIGGAWQRLFRKERHLKANLGWDAEYTKPGVMELLSQFKAKVDNIPSLGIFNYSI